MTALGDYYPPYIVGTNLLRYEEISAARRSLDAALDPYIVARTAFAQRARACDISP